MKKIKNDYLKTNLHIKAESRRKNPSQKTYEPKIKKKKSFSKSYEPKNKKFFLKKI